MQTFQHDSVSLPVPSRWGIVADIAGRPMVHGALNISSLDENKLIGTINFRGIPIPITGNWNETTKQIRFESPFASYSGQLEIFDEESTDIRHLLFRGRFTMKPPSIQAGESGNWVALTDTHRPGPPEYTGATPPAAVFVLSNILYGNPNTYR